MHVYLSFVSLQRVAQMLGENLLAKFKKTPMAITAMRALKGENVGQSNPGFNAVGSSRKALPSSVPRHFVVSSAPACISSVPPATPTT